MQRVCFAWYTGMVLIFSDWQISLAFPVFFSFPVFFKVLFYLKYGVIFAGFSLLLADRFPWLFHYFFQFSSLSFSDFPVFLVRFPDFSSLSKIPWKMLFRFSRFSSFSSAGGNHGSVLTIEWPGWTDTRCHQQFICRVPVPLGTSICDQLMVSVTHRAVQYLYHIVLPNSSIMSLLSGTARKSQICICAQIKL